VGSECNTQDANDLPSAAASLVVFDTAVRAFVSREWFALRNAYEKAGRPCASFRVRTIWLC
jgi:hypothetical protein